VNGPVFAAYYLGDVAAFVQGEAVVLASPDGQLRSVTGHVGAILATASDGRLLVSGGDDGRVVMFDPQGRSQVVASDSNRRWIDRVAIGPDAAVAWSVGKTALAIGRKGEHRVLELPSSAGGLAFAPKGKRLAIAHYNGVTLWFADTVTAPVQLDWKGSHLDVVFSPGGKFVVTAMQESVLHGWRLVDGKSMRMSGYRGKVRSMAFTAGGDWLATSGSEQLILWPFQGEDGPMGKSPRALASYSERAEIVACHPRHEIVAVGYADGLVLLVRIEDGAEILARRPGNGPVSALAWNRTGSGLAIATESGEASIIDLS